jgi:transcriptional regulator with XRE-family HTH domain
MVYFLSLVHPAQMAKRKDHKPHFLREWRMFNDLTLEAAAEKIGLLSAEWTSADPENRPVTMTHATLSRIERGKLPYNQHLLELLADVYRTDIPSLIMRDPTEPDGIWSIWDGLSPPQKTQVVEIAKTIKRTGTEG